MDRKDMTARQIASSVWKEMKTRHTNEIASMQENHFKECARIVSAQMAERERIAKELNGLLDGEWSLGN